MHVDQYCRDIEAYLCRKNDGHLIRVVGPSFERVSRWAEQGIPLKVACRGIDRYFDRYYAKGPRRRPVRIDHCEADVLDIFDQWRRAVGIMTPAPDRPSTEPGGTLESAGGGGGPAARSRASLPAHLERVIARLTGCRTGGQVPPALDSALERIVRELDGARASARALRGESRSTFLARLDELDRDLVDTARGTLQPAALQAMRDEAAQELAPFRDRMPEEQRGRAIEAALTRLIRERLGLPTVSHEP